MSVLYCVKNCGRNATFNGFCDQCYESTFGSKPQRADGIVPKKKRGRPRSRRCSQDNCQEYPTYEVYGGICDRCYEILKRKEMDFPPDLRKYCKIICKWPACKSLKEVSGYCDKHYRRVKTERDAVIRKDIEDKEREEKSKIIFTSTNPGQDRIDWIEKNLKDAEYSDRPFRFADFQKEFIVQAFSTNASGKRIYNEAMLTCGRKNGKTTGMGALAIAEMRGPWGRSFDMPVGSVDKKAAGTMYYQTKKILKNSKLWAENHRSKKGVRGNDTEKVLTNLENEARLVCLASDSDNTLSFIPGAIIFIDELGFHKDRKLYNSMDTGRTIHNPLVIDIGTRGDEDSLFNKFLKIHEENPSPTRLVHQYITEEEIHDPFDEKTWFLANPGLGTIKDLDLLRSQFHDARSDDEKLHTLKLFDLNMKMDKINTRPFIDAPTWMRCAYTASREGPCYLGIDMAESNDLACVAAYWYETGALWVKAYVPSTPSLEEREKKDRLHYRGLPTDELMVAGKYALDYQAVAEDILKFHYHYAPDRAYADPNRIKRLIECLEDNGKNVEGAHFPVFEFIWQQFLGMNPCIEQFERLLREGKVAHSDSRLLKRAISTARVKYDDFMNRTFSKSSSAGKIDPLVAATLAAGGSAPKNREIKRKKKGLADYYKHNQPMMMGA